VDVVHDEVLMQAEERLLVHSDNVLDLIVRHPHAAKGLPEGRALAGVGRIEIDPGEVPLLERSEICRRRIQE